MQSFSYIETIPDAQFTADTIRFKLTETVTPKILLLRGLTGHIRIAHNHSESEFDQQVDYLDLEARNTGVNVFERIRTYISEDITLAELCAVFANPRFLRQNLHFFQRLTQEFFNFCYYQNKGSHTTAFIYLYRMLETISYSFPLIYTAKTSDFKQTFSLLKGYMSGNKDLGELGFFKKFIKAIFQSDPALELSITIDIVGSNTDIQQVFFDCFKKAGSDELWHPDDTDEPRKLSVRFTEFSSFIIKLRNRFFHLLNSGQPNI